MRSLKITPDWSSYVNLKPSDVAKLPGLQQFLLLYGRNRLNLDYSKGITWTCCGIYSIDINEGGLEAEIIESPDPAYYVDPIPRYMPWDSMEALGEVLGGDLREAYTNPFSWDPLTPIILRDQTEGPPGCLYDKEYNVSLFAGSLASLRPARLTRCSKITSKVASRSTKVGRFVFKVKTTSLTRDLKRLELPSGYGYQAGDTIILKSTERCSIEIESPYYDHNVSILYPGSFYSLKIINRRVKLGPLPAIVVGLWSSLAIASREGIVIDVKPGKIIVGFKGSLRIALGGMSVAYRLFLEDLIAEWRPVKLPSDGLGNIRTSTGALMIADEMRDNVMTLYAYNPLNNPGVGEIRLPANSKEAIVIGPLGETAIPIAIDFFRLPIAPGFIGVIEIELSRKNKFLKFIRSRRT